MLKRGRTPRPGRFDLASGLEQLVLIGVLAIAALISYTHLRDVWIAAGSPWPGFGPLLVDGLFAAAWLRMRRRRREGEPVGFLAWGALGLALVATLAGNVAAAVVTGHTSWLSIVVAAWPALAFALVWELVTGHGRGKQSATPSATPVATPVVAPDATPTLASATPPAATPPATPATPTVGEPAPWRPRTVADRVAELDATPATPHLKAVATPKVAPLRHTPTPTATVTAKAATPALATPAAPVANGDPVAKARALLADETVGRRRLAAELDLKPHQARALLANREDVDRLLPRYLAANA